MRILVVNPVNTQVWDEITLNYLQGIASPGTEVVVKSLPEGPETIESEFDKALAESVVIKLVAEELRSSSYDAVIINCFDDPGVKALREAVSTLVLGIGETSITAALMLGGRIAIISTGRESRNIYWRRAVELGIADRVAFTGGVELGVMELRRNDERTVKELVRLGSTAVKDYGAEVIVLGCGGFIGLADKVSKQLNVPVIDPTPTTFKIAEALASLRLRHSRAYTPKHVEYRFTSLSST